MILNDNTCVSCGKYAPEGSMLCNDCQKQVNNENIKTMECYIRLNHIAHFPEFEKLAQLCPGGVYLTGNNYRVSAKSLMGIFSLDISKPIKVEVYGDTPVEFIEGIKKYITIKEV